MTISQSSSTASSASANSSGLPYPDVPDSMTASTAIASPSKIKRKANINVDNKKQDSGSESESESESVSGSSSSDSTTVSEAKSTLKKAKEVSSAVKPNVAESQLLPFPEEAVKKSYASSTAAVATASALTSNTKHDQHESSFEPVELTAAEPKQSKPSSSSTQAGGRSSVTSRASRRNMNATSSSSRSINTTSSGSNGASTQNESLPYQDAGLPIRRQSITETTPSRRNKNNGNGNNTKRKSRIKLGAKLMKLRKKRDMKDHALINDEETQMNGIGRSSANGRAGGPTGEVEELTANGNSLPNLGPSRKRENAFFAWKRMYCGDKTRTGTSGDNTTCGNYACFLLIFSFILGTLIVIIAGDSNHRYPKEPTPTYAPEPTRPPAMTDTNGDGGKSSGHGDFTMYQWEIHKKISLVSSVDIDLPGTPQYKAAQWMFHEDEMGYDADSPYLFQRFVLGILFYQMENDGKKCFDLNESIDECDWDRIDCDIHGFVEKISFAKCNIGGPIPIEIPLGFEYLKSLDLSGNNLIGTIPSDLGNLLNLESLHLERNPNLEGKVPAFLCRHKEIGKLIDFTVQCSLQTSKVDCSCCDHCNGKPDDVPDDIGGSRQNLIMEKLKALSGDVVKEVGTPQHQAAEWIIEDDEGQYPSQSDFLYQRYVLAMLHFMMEDDNMSMLGEVSGTDECNWDGITCNGDGHLTHIHFEKRGVSGPIPMEFKILTHLTHLDLSSNKLSGEIITGLSLLSSLESLYLTHNDLHGSVPKELCDRHDSGKLAHIHVDCGTGGTVVCNCCNNCDVRSSWDANQREIWNRLESLSGNKLSDVNSPQYAAAHWIMNDDKWQYSASSKFLYQRYILVLLYKMMGVESWFAPSDGMDECKWERVGCSHDGFVEHVELDDCSMSGPIPKELKELHELKYLDLSSNDLTGTVPPELSVLQKLETIILDTNSIVGTIPEGLCGLKKSGNLQTVQVDCSGGSIVGCDCCDCSGIDDSHANNQWNYNQEKTWERLEALSGEALSNQNSPQYKAANWIINEDKWHYSSSSNFLEQRYVLVLLHMNMMGPGEMFVSGEDECKWERVGCNHDGYVENINIDHSKLTGSIPVELKALKELKYLDLSSNAITGEVPPELSQLTKLETLILDSNNIEGKIPQEVCALHTGGLLAQISADCKADNTFKVRCSCCFNCPASQSQPASCPKYSVATYFGVEEVEENVRAKEIETKCLELSGDKICQHNTPQNLAMKWMIFDDRLRLDITSLDFIQRYAMTVIYFSLGPDAWIDSFWLSPREDECQITGVKCDKEMRITSLNFTDSGMEGILPPEVSELSELVYINFSDNEIDGNIPLSWQRLTKLEFLDLTFNEMTGSVSDEICKLTKVQNLQLDVDCDNIECTCCDDCIGSGTTINTDPRAEGIKVKVDALKSKNHSNMNDPSRTRALNWIIYEDGMKLSADSQYFEQRYVLAVFYFALDGDGWLEDKSDKHAWLSNESYCSWFGITCDNGMNDVLALNLPSFNLKGDLPYELEYLNKLRVIDLKNNKITGSIPEQFSELTELSILFLYDNEITINLDEKSGVCELRSDHALNELWVDCSEPESTCPSGCCTKCGLLATEPNK